MKFCYYLKSIFILSLLLSCSRYAPLTSTKIKISGIAPLTSKGAQAVLAGKNTDGEGTKRVGEV